MTRILLLGKNGQVGWELQRSLQPLAEVIAVGRDTADLSDPDALRSLLGDTKPGVIVNAAAYTAVDRAESECDLAMQINATAPAVLAEEAAKRGALLVHYSTDYVFDGRSDKAYLEEDVTAPLNHYGTSKLAGEIAIRASTVRHLIFRTSWVYAARGSNFLRTILRLAREREELRVVADQFGAPTSARLIADTTAAVLARALRQNYDSGVYHLTAAGATSWHGFASAIVAGARRRFPTHAFKTQNLTPITTADYPLPAVRPVNSRLNCEKIARQFDIELPGWEAGLALCLEDLAAAQGN